MRRFILLLFAVAPCFAQYPMGWSQQANTKVSTVVAPNGGPSGTATCPSPYVSGLCDPTMVPGGLMPFQLHHQVLSIMNAWNGGIYDSLNHQMVFPHGNGHGDGFDNSIYSVFLNAAGSIVRRIFGPSTAINNSTVANSATNTDGTINARHTYFNAVELGYKSGKLMICHGAVYWGGEGTGDCWLETLGATSAASQQLTQLGASVGWATDTAYAALAWDEAGNRVILAYKSNLFSGVVNASATPPTVTWTLLSGNVGGSYELGFEPTCDIDPVMRLPMNPALNSAHGTTPFTNTTPGRWLVCVGNRYPGSSNPHPGTFRIAAVDISGNDSTYSSQVWTGTLNDGVTTIDSANGTCNPLSNLPSGQGGPGFTYHNALGKFVGLPNEGGNTVYLFSTVTQSCQAVTFPGGPLPLDTSANVGGTSATSATIALGSFGPLTTQSALSWSSASPASRLRIICATGANAGAYVEGQITTYSGTSLTILSDATSGSGTCSSWTIGKIVMINGTYGKVRYMRDQNAVAVTLDSYTDTYVLNLDSPTPGLGQSTSTCVDKDGDGYGAGAGCTGQDADDENAAVHTAAQAISAYGSLDATYRRRGYYPTRYWTIDPASGNDGTAASCTPVNFGTGGGSDCKPFAHWSALSGSVAAGDAVVFRAGTYSFPITIAGGNSSANVYYLGYPGELPVFRAFPNVWTVSDQAYWVIDGIKFDGLGDTTSGTGCIQGRTLDTQPSSTLHDWIIRNVECTAWLNGPYMFNGLQNGLIELSSFHDMTGSHGVYLGSRAMVSGNIIIRRNLLYRNSRCGAQFNGRVADLHVEQNYAYQNGIVDGGDDICLENGVHDSFVRSNVALGSQYGITMNTYDGSEFGGSGSSSNCGSAQNQNCTCGATPNLFAICPFSEFDNVFSNNTVVNTGQDANGADISGGLAYQIGRQPTLCTTATCLATSFPRNTWQNMVILSKGSNTYYPQFTFTTGSTSPESGPTNTLNGAVYFQTVGTAEIFGYGLQSPCCGYQSYTCTAAVSGGHLGSAASCTKSDPKFVSLGAFNNIAGYNLRLQASSAAVGTGTPLGTLPMDIIGTPLNTTAPSMGAFEFIQSCSITTSSLPGGTVGTLYSQTLAESNCTSSLNWGSSGLGSGACSGLSLSIGGVLSGTPTTGGTCNFTATYDTASKPLAIAVSGPVIQRGSGSVRR